MFLQRKLYDQWLIEWAQVPDAASTLYSFWPWANSVSFVDLPSPEKKR